jgi:Do/DeqQ family serine protease
MGCLSFFRDDRLKPMQPIKRHILSLVAVALILGGTAATALAQAPAPVDRVVPTSRAETQLSFAPVVRKVAPAVVNIYTRKVEVTRKRSPLMDDPLWRRFFPDDFAAAGPVRKRVRTSLGSGVIVDAGGTIITNVHVVRGAEEIRVVLSDRREFDARVVLTDPRTDLAVLSIDTGGEQLPFLRFFDSDKLEVGDLVLAIGNPFGVGQTVTSGIVSGLARTTVGVTDFRFFIQTDAAINPGNSGGALVTMDGRLAGINTAIYSRSGGSVGIGFAVPSAMVRTVVAAVAAGGPVVRPWIGATGRGVSAAIAGSIGMARPRGVIVGRVHPASPAAAAGIRIGDIIVAVNGHQVDDPQALRFRFATLPVGGTAKVSVIRGGREISVDVALKPAPQIPLAETTRMKGNLPLAGTTIANLSPALADAIGLDTGLEGVIVLQVAPGSAAQRLRMQKGDILRAVNTHTVTSVAALKEYLKTAGPQSRWRISFDRKGRTLTVVVGGGGP